MNAMMRSRRRLSTILAVHRTQISALSARSASVAENSGRAAERRSPTRPPLPVMFERGRHG
jgi:hypothetical protein